MLKIVIDAGHGYNTPGKRSPDGMREYEFNREVALAMKQELETYEGVQILFTHSEDRDVPLTERTNRANEWRADVFVSIHANAYMGEMGNHGGIDTFIDDSNPAGARALATVVQRNLIEATGLANRGVKTADFHVLRETKMTAILIEHGFMDSYTDLPKLKSPEYRKLCGVTNARSIAEHYRLTRKAPQKTPVEIAKEKELAQMAENQKATGFKDVPANSPYAEAVKYLKEQGIFAGYDDGTFRVNENLTRGQMAIVLHKILTK